MTFQKVFCLMLALLVTLTVAGCAEISAVNKICENDVYTLEESNGTYWLNFHEQLPKQGGGDSADGQQIVDDVCFGSVKEMKEAIRKGKFSDEAIQTITRYFQRNPAGDVKTCNINQLYEAALPSDLSVTKVSWYGETYSFSIEGGGITGYMTCGDQALYDDSQEKGMGFLSNEDIIIDSQTTVADRNATEYRYTSAYGVDVKIIVYTADIDGKNITILESYHSHESTVPQSVRIWGMHDSKAFYCFVTNFTERPSYEWVTSFGLKPYVETETE